MVKSLTIVIVVVEVFNLSTGKECLSVSSDAACLVGDDAYMSPEISFIQARTTMKPVESVSTMKPVGSVSTKPITVSTMKPEESETVSTTKPVEKETVSMMKPVESETVDCEWGEWQLGSCSVTCGVGQRTNI